MDKKNQKNILNQKKKVNNFLFYRQILVYNKYLNDKNLEVLKQAKLMGVIISDDLKWDMNMEYLVKKANGIAKKSSWIYKIN